MRFVALICRILWSELEAKIVWPSGANARAKTSPHLMTGVAAHKVLLLCAQDSESAGKSFRSFGSWIVETFVRAGV